MTWQWLADGLITGVMVGLGAVGVTLTYSLLGFANFAHGEFISWGGYLTLVLAAGLGGLLPASMSAIGPLSVGGNLIVAAGMAMLLTGLLAIALDIIMFRPLRARAAPITAVIASFGASMALRAALEAVFSSQPVYLSRQLQMAIPVVPGLRVTPDQIAVLCTAAALIAALHVLLNRTHMGRSMRAAAENPLLARIVGIDVAAVIRFAWFVGGGLACVSGVMLGLIVQLRPSMGADLMLPLFAAAIFGGIGSVMGALLGGLAVGVSEALAVRLFGAEWREAAAFAIVIGVLLIRPNGLFGRAI